jgi:hypothetical protein
MFRLTRILHRVPYFGWGVCRTDDFTIRFLWVGSVQIEYQT